LASDAGPIECLLSGVDRHFAGRPADVPLPDTCSFEDPLVARIDGEREVIVREDLLGEIGTPPDDSAAAHG